MVYFESARLEFFDVPVFWWPYMSNPDPSVKRKTGWLPPMFSSSGLYGVAITTPYYWALAPNYDVTVSPTVTTRQGLLLHGTGSPPAVLPAGQYERVLPALPSLRRHCHCRCR